MRVIVLAVILCHFRLSAAASISGGCGLSLKTDLPKKNDPLYLVTDPKGRLQLAFPDDGTIDLKPKQELVLACTGNKNALLASGDPVTGTSCTSGSSLKVGSKSVASVTLECSSRSAASLKITDDRCGDKNSVVIQSGFQVGGDWLPLVDTCHNINDANSLWSTHILYGSRLSGKVIQSNRPGFSRGDKALFKGFNPDQAYQQTNQEEVFARIYGKKSAAKYIVKENQFYLARGHLSPDADFLFATWQMLTYFYVNVAPQWQSINAGNWLGVENNARKLAINIKTDLLDITGTHGILSLADDRGVMREAYLQGDRLPVPEYYWKLLRNQKDGSCVVLVSTNNPHLTAPPKPICPDICAKNGWPLLQRDLTKGYVYCCDYKSFKAAVPHVPTLNCKSVLKFK